jgi:GAF domain-containing protein
MSHADPAQGLDALVAAAVQAAALSVERGAPLRDTLTRLVSAAEQVAGQGSTSSILLIDGEGLLRNGASPNLPADYLDAIDRLRPDPDVGTCAAAAATGLIVLTPDFNADAKWAELRHLPAAIGFRGAWSMPIKDASGRVLGTFGTYFREKRTPTQAEMQAVARLVEAAAKAIAASGTEATV